MKPYIVALLVLASCADDEPVRVSGTISVSPTLSTPGFAFVSISTYANHDPLQAVTLDSVPFPASWPMGFDVSGGPGYPGMNELVVRAWLTHEKDTWYLEGNYGETPVTLTCADEDTCEAVDAVSVVIRQ